MGFKDFFSKGPSGRNDSAAYYSQGLPSSAQLAAANSATNRRYQENMTPQGLLSTRSLRDQPHRLAGERTMSLSSRSLRPTSQQPRTMSMTARSNSLTGSYRQQPVSSRTMSMTSSIRGPSGTSRPVGVNRRANSLTASSIAATSNKQASYQNYTHAQRNNISTQSGSRVGSRNGSRANSLTRTISRANSLTSNSGAHTKITQTTEEKDHEGRTKSITTTTIEKRGDVKIVRKTTIRPFMPQPIDEFAELEELAELEDLEDLENFDHDHTIDDNVYGDAPQPTQGLHISSYEPHYADEELYYDQGDALDGQFEGDYEEIYEDPLKNGAALAAAAALNLNHTSKNGHPTQDLLKERARQRQLQVQRQREAQNQRQAEIEEKQAQISMQQHALKMQQRNEKVQQAARKQKLLQQKQYQQQQQLQNKALQQAKQQASKQQRSKVVTATPRSESKKAEVRFIDSPHDEDVFGSDFDQAESFQQEVVHSPGPQAVSKGPTQGVQPFPVQNSRNDAFAYNQEGNDDNDYTETMVVAEELSPGDSFHTRAQKRLSEIREVTEIYDDGNDLMEEPIGSAQDYEEEVNDRVIDASLFVKDSANEPLKNQSAVPAVETVSAPMTSESNALLTAPNSAFKNATSNSSLTSADEQYEEAQESLTDYPPAITDINAPLTEQSKSGHSYRNLLFNESKRSPIKNSIPNFDLHGDYHPSQMNTSHANQKQGFDEQTLSYSHKDAESLVSSGNISSKNHNQQGKKPLKSALKNSSSSIISPSPEGYNRFTSPQASMTGKTKTVEITEPNRKDITPEEMYAIAFKAAERKVYGDRLNVAPVPEMDAHTLQNTLANENPGSNDPIAAPLSDPGKGYGFSKPGSAYQSNAQNLGFKVHSLRNTPSSSKFSRTVENTDTSKLKKLFKQEQKKEKKQWAEERKNAVPRDVLLKAQQKVEKEVNSLPVNPEVELSIMQQQEREKKERHNAELQRQRQSEVDRQQSAQILQPQTDLPSGSIAKELQPLAREENITSTTSAKDKSSPKKLSQMFKFSKKKNAAAFNGDVKGHKKNASLVSQDTVPSAVSAGSKKTGFSFFGSSSEARTKEKELLAAPVQTQQNANNPVSEDNFKSVPASESLMVESKFVGKPEKNNNIHTIPEGVSTAPAHIAGSEEFKEEANLAPPMKSRMLDSNNASNLSKTGTHDSSVINNIVNSPTNEDSINVTNASKLASTDEFKSAQPHAIIDSKKPTYPEIGRVDVSSNPPTPPDDQPVSGRVFVDTQGESFIDTASNNLISHQTPVIDMTEKIPQVSLGDARVTPGTKAKGTDGKKSGRKFLRFFNL